MFLPRNWVKYRINSLPPTANGDRPPDIRSTSCEESSAISCQTGDSGSPTSTRGRVWTKTGLGTVVVAAEIMRASSWTKLRESRWAESRICLSDSKVCRTDSDTPGGYKNLQISTIRRNQKLKLDFKNFTKTYKSAKLPKFNFTGLATIIIGTLSLSHTLVLILSVSHQGKIPKRVYQKHIKVTVRSGQRNFLFCGRKIANEKCRNDTSRNHGINNAEISKRKKFGKAATLNLFGKTTEKSSFFSRSKIKSDSRDSTCRWTPNCDQQIRHKIQHATLSRTDKIASRSQHCKYALRIYIIAKGGQNTKWRKRASKNYKLSSISPNVQFESFIFKFCTDTIRVQQRP